MLYDRKNCSGFVSNINQKNSISCGGSFYAQSVRRILRAEEIGVIMLGFLKVSINCNFVRLKLLCALSLHKVDLQFGAACSCVFPESCTYIEIIYFCRNVWMLS